ncbi:MAG: NAD-dependent epimerase/dehydratase family protein, partial [Lautropia sp.]|nr:NAD-dependent epimerase/dehydratase family protein [Lautropia sp.]
NGNGNGNDDPLTRHWLLRLRAARPRLAGTQPRRLVYLSTTGIYGNRDGAWVSETDAPRPQTGRAARRVAAERLLRQANRQAPDRLATLVLRVPGIYGDDRLPVDRLRQLIPALLPEDDVITNHIHADDLARIAATALLRGPRQRTINAIDDSQLWLGDYLDLVADHLQLPRPPRFSRAELAQRLSPVRMSFMSESRRIRNQRLKRELRVRLRYPTVQDFLAGHVPLPVSP